MNIERFRSLLESTLEKHVFSMEERENRQNIFLKKISFSSYGTMFHKLSNLFFQASVFIIGNKKGILRKNASSGHEFFYVLCFLI